MALVDAGGLPIAVSVHSAQPHEVKLAFDLVQGCWTDELPERVIGDKAYDSDALDAEFEDCDIELIAPHRSNRKPENKTQHPKGTRRPLRRYKRRWKVERFFAWLQNFRRLVTRWYHKIEHFEGFVQLAAIIILIRNGF